MSEYRGRVRKRIAEAIAIPLKQAGRQTPILDQIPHKAEDLGSFYYQVAVERAGQIGELLKVPAFAHGKAYGDVAGMWYKVTFPKPILNANVACIPEGRTGAMPKVKLPSVNIASIDLPNLIPIEVPDFKLERPPMYYKRYADCSSVIRPICDGLNDFHKVFEDMQNKYGLAIESINIGFAKVRKAIDDTNKSIADFRNKVQKTLQVQTSNINLGVSEGMSLLVLALYNAWGISTNMAVTALHVRNVTSTGFEFQSLGKTTAHWLAMGTRA